MSARRWTSTPTTTASPIRCPNRCCASSPARSSCASSRKTRMTRRSKPWHSLPRSPKQYPSPRMPTLICDCNKTMPLQAKTLGTALNQELPLHTMLCRREAGAFQKAIQGSEDVVVACTQEQRLFGELAQQTEGALAPVKFVNIRETGGWSRD